MEWTIRSTTNSRSLVPAMTVSTKGLECIPGEELADKKLQQCCSKLWARQPKCRVNTQVLSRQQHQVMQASSENLDW